MTIPIPRVFHQVWLGKEPMPDEFVRYRKSWTTHHPGWTVRLWRRDTMPALQNQELYDKSLKFPQKTDIARYELLYRYGGVYIDADFECFRNMEPLLHGVEAFAALEDREAIGISILGARSGHPAFRALIDRLASWVRAHPRDPINVQTGPIYATHVLKGRKDITLFGPELFYPYSWAERHRKGEHFPRAYAAHHWAGAWL